MLLHDHLEEHKLQIEDTFQSQHAAIDFVQHEVYLLTREMRNQHLQVQAVDLCVVVEYLRLGVEHLDLAAQPAPTSCRSICHISTEVRYFSTSKLDILVPASFHSTDLLLVYYTTLYCTAGFVLYAGSSRGKFEKFANCTN